MSDDRTETPAAPDAAAAPAGPQALVAPSRRKRLFAGVAAGVALVALGYGAYAFFIGARHVSTDNAYVAADSAQITPLTAGQVIDVTVVDTQPVRKGQVLLRLDDADQRIAVARAEADLAAVRRKYGQTLAQGAAQGAAADAAQAAIADARARVAAARGDLDRAQVDYDRRHRLLASGAVSADEVTAATNALRTAQAGYTQAQAALAQAQANTLSARRDQDSTLALVRGTTVNTAPDVLQAEAALRQAKLDLSRTVIRAPMDGIVAKRTVQVGQRVDKGTVTMIVVPVNALYVDANFKENQLGKVKPGQKVELTSDLYKGDVVYHGRVVGFAGGTGAAFALIPAQNATGNWVKITQRLPLRIRLDPQPDMPRLRAGLSAIVRIDTGHRRTLFGFSAG